MMSSLCRCFHPLPLPDNEDNEEALAHQLKNLYLAEATNSKENSPVTVVTKERELKSRVCKTVLTSYDMSLRNTMQLVSSKLELAGALIQQLGGQGQGGSGSVEEVGELIETAAAVEQ